MLRTAFVSMFLSLFIFILGRLGWTGVSIEIGRIFLMVFLTLSAVVVGARLIFDRQHPDVF